MVILQGTSFMLPHLYASTHASKFISALQGLIPETFRFNITCTCVTKGLILVSVLVGGSRTEAVQM